MRLLGLLAVHRFSRDLTCPTVASMGDVVFVTGRGAPAPEGGVADGLRPAVRGALTAAPALVLALAGLFHRLGAGEPRPDEVRSRFQIGSPLGAVGSWALVAAAVLVAVDALVRRGVLAGHGLVLVPGALLVHTDHIFWPWGVLGMALVAVGTGWVESVRITR
jgi:hypothetical protein